MRDAQPVTPDLATLAGLFYPSTEALGEFAEVAADAMPPAFQTLLAHESHMTVAVEKWHRSPVDVRVLAKLPTDTDYARKILLARKSDGGVVQYGIMRIQYSHLTDAVRREIESEATPLGRVLIQHNVLRKVELFALWKVVPGDELRELLGMKPGQATYGRTALIHVDGEPAVELLEIVTPA
jgi:chorismate-pyruvate lyase